MIDHFNLPVHDLARSRKFYERVLAPRARSRNAVDAFYNVALAAGATPNGSPGVRYQYDPQYYAVFVLDPDGHNVEAVCRGGPDLMATNR